MKLLQLVMTGILTILLMGVPCLQPKLVIDFHTSEAGITQAYYPDEVPGSFSEQTSDARLIKAGEQTVRFNIPGLIHWVRWDPLRKYTELSIRNISVNIAFIKMIIAPDEVISTNQIEDIIVREGGVKVQMFADASDPSLKINLPWKKVQLIQVGLSIIVFLIGFIVVNYISNRSLALSKQFYFIVISSSVIMIMSTYIVGTIAVGGGTGWDGFLYLSHIQTLGRGDVILEDPYRSIRMGSFIPSVLIGGYGLLSRETIIIFQMVINILTISVSVGLLYDFLRTMRVTHRVALVSVLTFLFSWPVLIMPVYYPILSDHLALGITCLSLWLWGRGYQYGLYALCLWSPWIMPLLVLVPLVLAAMPKKNLMAESITGMLSIMKVKAQTTQIGFFITLAVISIYFALMKMNQFSLEQIDGHAALNSGLSELRTWSMVATCITIIATAWVWSLLLNSKSLFKSINLKFSLIAICYVMISFLLMWVAIDWKSGFTGPPLIDYIFLQSLSAPFKPHVSHVLYFGPVILMALSAFNVLRYKKTIPWPLIALFAGFLPALAIGSESRQWIAIFPVVISLFALSKQTMWLRITCLVMGVGLCLPALGLSNAVQHAVEFQENFMSSNWQYYFGRQGPWMSPETYHMGIAFCYMFLLTVWGVGSFVTEKKNTNHSNY